MGEGPTSTQNLFSQGFSFFVLDHRRRRGEQAAALARLHQRGLPQLLTRLGIECDGTAISGADVHPAVPVGDATRAGRGGNLLGDGVEFGTVVPQFPARRTVQSKDAVIGTTTPSWMVDFDQASHRPGRPESAGLSPRGTPTLLPPRW